MPVRRRLVSSLAGLLCLATACASPAYRKASPGETDLLDILDGSTLFLSAGHGGDADFQVNEMVIYRGSPIVAMAHSGPDLYYLAENLAGYYKNGAFQSLALKKYFQLYEIAVRADTVHIAGRESDSINANTAGSSFLLSGERKLVFPSTGLPALQIQKLLLGEDRLWAAGKGSEITLWNPDSFLSIGAMQSPRLLSLEYCRKSPLLAGLEGHIAGDMLWFGGWYWHQGQKHPIKYTEDGRDDDPFDHLFVRQFIASGDSLLAVGATADVFGSSYLWVNGKATAWEDTTVEKESLLGVARSKGTLFLLGQFRKDEKYVLCLWAKGARVDLKEADTPFQVSLFEVVDAGGLVAVRKEPRGDRPAKARKSGMRRGASQLFRKPGAASDAQTTVDGKLRPPLGR